jgi:hypothetical protein
VAVCNLKSACAAAGLAAAVSPTAFCAADFEEEVNKKGTPTIKLSRLNNKIVRIVFREFIVHAPYSTRRLVRLITVRELYGWLVEKFLRIS